MSKKKFIAMIISLILLIFIYSACDTTTLVEERAIDARFTPAYIGVETTYEYHLDILGEGGFKYMPNTHTVAYPDRYEVLYMLKYSDNSVRTEWRIVTAEEYNNYITESEE